MLHYQKTEKEGTDPQWMHNKENTTEGILQGEGRQSWKEAQKSGTKSEGKAKELGKMSTAYITKKHNKQTKKTLMEF